MYEPDDEARLLAQIRAQRQSPPPTGTLTEDPRVGAERYLEARRADPTAILDDTEPFEEVLARFTEPAEDWQELASFNGGLRVQGTTWNVGGTSLTIKASATVPPGGWIFSFDGFREEKDHATNKKRHGWASVCPRHGPTRGGHCRKCH